MCAKIGEVREMHAYSFAQIHAADSLCTEHNYQTLTPSIVLTLVGGILNLVLSWHLLAALQASHYAHMHHPEHGQRKRAGLWLNGRHVSPPTSNELVRAGRREPRRIAALPVVEIQTQKLDAEVLQDRNAVASDVSVAEPH